MNCWNKGSILYTPCANHESRIDAYNTYLNHAHGQWPYICLILKISLPLSKRTGALDSCDNTEGNSSGCEIKRTNNKRYLCITSYHWYRAIPSWCLYHPLWYLGGRGSHTSNTEEELNELTTEQLRTYLMTLAPTTIPRGHRRHIIAQLIPIIRSFNQIQHSDNRQSRSTTTPPVCRHSRGRLHSTRWPYTRDPSQHPIGHKNADGDTRRNT